jgi:2-haloacid dehalogenase
MKYNWLLFDADDTLFDFARAEAMALKSTLEQVGLTFKTEHIELYARFNHQVWTEFEQGKLNSQELRTKRFKLFFEGAGLNGDPESTSPLYLQNLALGTYLLEGADEVVHALKKRYRLALVTNGLKEVQRPRLQGSSLNDCFEKIFISEEVGAAKPEQAYFERVFNEIGRPSREEVLIIGDSLTSDMQGGLNYGIDTCWYNPQKKTSPLTLNYQINHLQELLSLL